MNSLIKEKDDDKFKAEKHMLREMFSLFMVDYESLDKNLWLLSLRSKGGLSIEKIEQLPFWRYEQFVGIANKLSEEEKETKKTQEEKQKANTPNMNAGSYLNKLSGMSSKFKK